MKHLITILIILTTTFSTAFGQDCKATIRKAIDQMADYDADAAIFFRYNIHTVLKTDSINEASITLITKAQNYSVESNDVSIYQNADKRIMVMHGAKKVYIANAFNQKNYTPADVQKMHAKILDGAMVVECIQECVNEAKNRQLDRVMLKTSKEIEETYNINKVEYWIDPDFQSVSKIGIVYTLGFSVKYLKMEIVKYDKNYKRDVFTGSVVQMMADLSVIGRLYQGYDVIDDRQQ